MNAVVHNLRRNRIAARVVPKNVIAITRVASNTIVCMPTIFQAYMIEIITAGITISSKAFTGVRVRDSIFDTHSGSMRSKAAAKITRVDERNTVPDQPIHQKLTARTTRNCRKRLPVRKVANCTG